MERNYFFPKTWQKKSLIWPSRIQKMKALNIKLYSYKILTQWYLTPHKLYFINKKKLQPPLLEKLEWHRHLFPLLMDVPQNLYLLDLCPRSYRENHLCQNSTETKNYTTHSMEKCDH